MATLIPNYQLSEQIGKRVDIPASTVDELIRAGTERFGEPFRSAVEHAAILVNGRSINLLRGGKTPLGGEDVVWLVVPSGGG